jgi:hypothetical protein
MIYDVRVRDGLTWLSQMNIGMNLPQNPNQLSMVTIRFGRAISQAVAGVSPRRTVFAPGSVHVVHKVTLREVSSRVLLFSPVNSTSELHAHILPGR